MASAADRGQTSMRNRKSAGRPRLDRLLPIVPLVVVLVVWQAVMTTWDIPGILFPRPMNVLRALYRGLSAGLDQTSFWYHGLYTLLEAGIGLAIGVTVGLGLGIALGSSRVLEKSLYPYVVAFQGLPKMAMAPLFIVWLGFGIPSKIALVVLVTFFPIMINTWAGMKSVDENMIAMVRSFNASPKQAFRMITLPSALPYIFAGLDIAVAYSIVSAIVSEFIGAQRGLGYLIEKMNYSLDMAGLFAIFGFLLVVGYVANRVLGLLRRRYLFWLASERPNAGM